jgi:hemolysin III
MAEQTRLEEVFNSSLHAIGAIAAITGLLVLVRGEGDPLRLFSYTLFCGSMVILYSSSSFYHATTGAQKQTAKKVDQLAIYLLIASTYAPFALILLAGDTRGKLVFVGVWLLALIGILYDLVSESPANRNIPVMIYLLMGWMALILAVPLMEKLSLNGFLWLLAGGLSYTFGLLFYAFDHRVRFFHAAWHLFVLAGSFFHFWVVYRYIATV